VPVPDGKAGMYRWKRRVGKESAQVR